MKVTFQYLKHLKPNKAPLIAGILCACAEGLSSGFGVPYFMSQVFNDILNQKDSTYGTWEIIGIASLLPLAFLMRGVTGYASQYLLNFCAHHALKSVRNDLFKKLNYLPLAFHNKNLSGDLMSRLASDSAVIQQIFLSLANDLVRQPTTMISAIGFLIYLSLQNEEVIFILLLIAIAPVTVLIVKLIGNHLKKRGREALPADA
jgi:subfamily B ATP-binding cassette protein MsbA